MITSELLQEKAKGTPPEWAAKEQAEFRQFVQQFGFHLATIKPEKGNLEDDYVFGGELKDKGKDELMDVEMRLKALKKGLSTYLLDKAKDSHWSVKIFQKSWWKHAPSYIHPEDSTRAAEQAVERVVGWSYDRYIRDKKFLFVHWQMTAPRPRK